MKKLVLLSLLVIGCSSNLTSQKVYENVEPIGMIAK